MARPAGFEPTTPWFVAKYSIQLSYGRCKDKNYSRVCRLSKNSTWEHNHRIYTLGDKLSLSEMAELKKPYPYTPNSLSALIESRLSRRQWLKASLGSVAMTISGTTPGLSHAFSFKRKAAAATVSLPTAPEFPIVKSLDFDPVGKSTADRVVVPKGYEVSVFLPTGTSLSKGLEPWTNDGSDRAESMAKRIGDFHNGIKFLGMSEQQSWDPSESDTGILCISHRGTNPEFLHPTGMMRLPRSGHRPTSQIMKEIYAHGFSLTEVKRDEQGNVDVVLDSEFNRRVTADTMIDLSGPVKGSPYVRTAASPSGTQVRGTLGNNGMTVTPWGTILTGEGDWSRFFYRSSDDMKKRNIASNAALARVGILPGQATFFDWHKNDDPRFDRWDVSVRGYDEVGRDDFRNEANTLGYIVETDPFKPHIRAIKRTAMGRISHRDAWIAPAQQGKPIVIYLTDDGPSEYVYKFVSDAAWDPADTVHGLRAGAKYLDHGHLFVARFNAGGKGEWLPLEYGKNGLDRKNKVYPFADPADLLINLRLAADAVGATKLDRPGWAVTHSQTGETYLTLTYDNSQPDSVTGHVIRWREADGSPTATVFSWDVYLMGGNNKDSVSHGLSKLTETNAFHIPNGIWSDPRGILWVQTDESANQHASNSMMLAALAGEVGDGNESVKINGLNGKQGKPPSDATLKRFMTGPIGSQISGVDMTPDCRTMFVNIQHPGLGSTLANMTSHWPDSQNQPSSTARPRSATVVIRQSNGKPIASNS